MRLTTNTPEPQWERVAALGLTSHADQPSDDTLPGALDIHCYRTPDSVLKEAPFIIELTNLQTGEHASVATDQDSLLHMAQTLLHAALCAHPLDRAPEDYFATTVGNLAKRSEEPHRARRHLHCVTPEDAHREGSGD